MSVFKVQLNNTRQGLLDRDPSTASAGNLGGQMAVSKQRSVYVMGPNRINRLLKDGDTFTDCNYWKKFAYPQVSLENAIVTVLVDDGSVYSDVASENVYPMVYNLTINTDTTWDDDGNSADIIGDTGGYAVFAQITNKDSSGDDLRMRLNGSASAIMDLPANSTQVFNSGDLNLSLIEFENPNSGGQNVDVQIVLSVRSVMNS